MRARGLRQVGGHAHVDNAVQEQQRVRISVLGPTEVIANGRRLQLTQQDLRVLTALVAVAADAETDSEHVEAYAWHEPPSPRALQSSVYRLRKLLGDDAIITRRRRVLLNRERVVTDLDEFIDLAGSDPLAAPRERGPLGAALGLVRGAPFDTMAGHPAWADLRGRWADRVDDLIDAMVHQVRIDGDVSAAIPLAREHLSHVPSSGRRWMRLIDLLASVGRRADALRTVEQARASLNRSAANEPAPLLDLLERERAILSGAVTALPPNDHNEHPPPLGRDAEYCSVQRALDHPDAGAIVLYGPEGAGKTTLMNAVATSWTGRGGRVLRVAGNERLPSTFDELAEALASAFPRIKEVRNDVFLLHEGLRNEGRVLMDPTLVCIDDAQWLEGDALTRLASLWRGAAPSVRVMLCLRPGTAAVERVGLTVPFHLVEIGPLTLEATSELLRVAGALTDPEGVAVVHSATQGNPGLIATYLQLRRRSSSSQFSLAAVVEQRLAALHGAAQRLVQLAAVAGTPLADLHLPDLLALDRVEARSVAAEAIESGLVVHTHEGVRLADHLHEVVRGFMTSADRTETARRLLALPFAATDPAAVLARGRLHLLADPVDGWRDAVAAYGTAFDLVNSFDTARRLAIAEAAYRDLTEAGAPRSAYALVHLRLGLAAHMSGRVDVGRNELETAYCVALDAGDASTAVHVVAHSSDATMVAVTDVGDDARALVALWRDNPDLSGAQRIRLDAVAALHEMARYDADHGARLARAAAAAARATGDKALLADVLAMVVVDEAAGRDLTDEAVELMALSRASGRTDKLAQAAMYQLCALMRNQQATFEHPLLTELAMLAERNPSTALRLRHRLVALARLVVHGHRAEALDGLSVLRGGLPSRVPPLLERAILTLESVALAPEWREIDPVRFVGDPAVVPLSAPTDVVLWRAAEAVGNGSARRAEQALRQLNRSVVAGRTSPLAITRLPLLALVVQRVGSRELAAQHLQLNLSQRGHDLSMLPAFHLGPTDLWLSLLAEVAGDPSAATLASAGAARLSDLAG